MVKSFNPKNIRWLNHVKSGFSSLSSLKNDPKLHEMAKQNHVLFPMFRDASNRKVLEISGAWSPDLLSSPDPGLVAGPETCFGPLGIIHRQWHRQKTGDEVNHQGERRRSGVRQAILHGHHRLYERMGKVGNVVLIFWGITRIDWRYWKTFLCLKPIRFHRPNSFQGGPLCCSFCCNTPTRGFRTFAHPHSDPHLWPPTEESLPNPHVQHQCWCPRQGACWFIINVTMLRTRWHTSLASVAL